MLRQIFETKKEEEKYQDINSANILDSKYGFLFNNFLYIPNRDSIGVIPNTSIFNLNFTILPFQSFLNEWKWYCNVQRIPKSSLFHINKYELNQGFFSTETLYKVHFFEILLTDEEKSVYTFNDFVDLFFKLAEQKQRMVSLSRFIESSVVSVFSTGLAYSIFNESEIERKRNYVNDSHFEVFRNLCLKHNFLVDNKLPWVIVYRVDAVEPIRRHQSYTSVYKEEISIILESLRTLWLEYVNDLSENEKKKIESNDVSYNTKKLYTHFVKAKCREKKMNVSALSNLIRWYTLNTEKNGIEDSNYKLSALKFNAPTLKLDTNGSNTVHQG